MILSLSLCYQTKTSRPLKWKTRGINWGKRYAISVDFPRDNEMDYSKEVK